MAEKLLKSENANVVIVDWGNGSAPPYTQAVANIRLVGRITAVLIYILKVTCNFSIISSQGFASYVSFGGNHAGSNVCLREMSTLKKTTLN